MSFLQKLRQYPTLFYTIEMLAKLFSVTPSSARVLASRKTASGELVRLKRNFYVPADNFERSTEEDLFKLANLIQTPSYISFVTALSYHGLTTQMQQGIIESANPVRSKVFTAGTIEFHYHYCDPKRYSQFVKKNGFFIASPEKALIDALYLVSLGRYALDEKALNVKNFDWKTALRVVKSYSRTFQKFFSQWRDTCKP